LAVSKDLESKEGETKIKVFFIRNQKNGGFMRPTILILILALIYLILVSLSLKKTVAVESTYLTSNLYYPPGIVGRGEWKDIGIDHYNPRKVAGSLKEEMFGGMAIQEYDWWNVEIYRTIFENWTGSPAIPPNYYDVARNYVRANYTLPRGRTERDLIAFLNQVRLREYERGVFDCSEASAMLEWLLEGAGFEALMAYDIANDGSAHMWVLVKVNIWKVDLPIIIIAAICIVLGAILFWIKRSRTAPESWVPEGWRGA
jgi:uncharacterized integral membrane protein